MDAGSSTGTVPGRSCTNSIYRSVNTAYIIFVL